MNTLVLTAWSVAMHFLHFQLNSEEDFPEEEDESTDFAEYRETHIPY